MGGTMTLALYCGMSLWAGDPIPAFPGAEGFGTPTPAGRGGRVLFVTNLEDSGPGSLRAACQTKGPRIILFRVAGNIRLQSSLRIDEPFVTIAGQSAPPPGITLADCALVIKTHDVLVRHLRVRPGDTIRKEQDSISVGGERVVIDHCSASWSIDETLSVTNSQDCTVSWCFITESLNDSHHHKGPHGYGSLITGPSGGLSFHHNLYAHHRSRCPRPGAPKETEGVIFDFRGNVIYNWGDRAGYSAETPVRMNYVGNTLIPGAGSRNRDTAFLIGSPATRIFMRGNQLRRDATTVLLGPDDDQRPLLALSRNFEFPEDYGVGGSLRDEPFPAPPISPAAGGWREVVQLAGATLPTRDTIDQRVAREVLQGEGMVIDSQRQVGGWIEVPAEDPAKDSDGDGMPDVWELAHGLDPQSPDPSTLDRDGDGYPDLEEYLNGTDPRVPEPIPSAPQSK